MSMKYLLKKWSIIQIYTNLYVMMLFYYYNFIFKNNGKEKVFSLRIQKKKY